MRSRGIPLLILAGALVTGGAAAQHDEAAEAPLTFDVVFGDDGGGRLAESLSWSADGSTIAYLWDDGQGKALWALDTASGERRVLAREGGEQGLELGTFRWAPAGGEIVVESGGDLYLIEPAAGAPRRLTETAEKESEARLSPAGGRLAFVRDFDLWVLDLASGEETRLTDDGSQNEVLNGVADWVYWEEIWGRDATGYWWSPDGDRIAYYRFDESPVGSYPLVDFTTVPYPAVEQQRYPKAGTANPVVGVGVVPAGGGDTVWLDTRHEPDDYLARVDWQPGGERVAVQRLNREQDTLELLTCDAGNGSCALLVRETWPTWVNLHGDLRFLPDGGFLWSSEKSGWRRLYLHGPDGSEVRPVTPEGWSVTSLDALHARKSWFVYTAYRSDGLGAKGRQVFRGSTAGTEPVPLSPPGGWSSAVVAPHNGNMVIGWSDADSPATQAVLDHAGRTIAELPAAAPPYDPEALPSWQLFTLPGPGGTALPAALLEPADRVPDHRYAVIMYHYGGPASQVVADRWGSRGRGLWHKMMAQRGFGVLMVDNPGSSYFGKRGEDRLHRRFGEVNLTAQLAGVEYLKGLDWVDPGRIGLWGWSGGGANTLYSILKSPGSWAAAVAGAPVTDWRLYDTIWTERYLDHPADNPDGYRDSSALTWAERLATPLLIVHGTADDNVHPQNTLALVAKLVEAGKPVETAIYPRQKHGFRGPASRHFYERMTEFFERTLRAPSGPTASSRP